MGVTGLWQLYSHTTITLAALSERYTCSESCRGVRLGLDAFNLMAIVCRGDGDKQVTPQVALGRLFEHLCNLLKLPILPLFVFDGPTRPTLKRRRAVFTGAFHIEREFRELIDAFGFQSWNAPGEAEAELAMLGRLKVVDVVLTNDSDAMLFGTPRVIRPSLSMQRHKDHRELDTTESGPHLYYDSTQPSALASHDIETLVMYALLIGGDYSDALAFDFSDASATRGMSKYDRERRTALAMRLAREQLTDGRSTAHALIGPLATLCDDRDALQAHVEDWRARFVQLVERPTYAKLVKFVPREFPDIDALHLYHRPLVSSYNTVICRLPQWPMVPDIAGLRRHATALLGSSEAVFNERMMAPVACNLVRKLALRHQPDPWLGHRDDARVREGRLLREYARTATAACLEVEVELGDEAKSTLAKTRVWVPSTLADYALLALL